MKVTVEAAEVQAADLQQMLQLRQSILTDQQQALRLLSSFRKSAPVQPVSAPSAGQKLNVRV